MNGMTRWCLVACALVLTGCMTTPQSRIDRNPALFASFPAEAQAKIRKGEVDIGYTKDMVLMALGAPRNVRARKTEAGESEVWVYTEVGYDSRPRPVYREYWYHDREGRLRSSSYDLAWADVGRSYEYPVLRIEFAGDKVKTLERGR